MESHTDGEVWGLAVNGNEGVVTSGDDNIIFHRTASTKTLVYESFGKERSVMKENQ
jgi:hypothetical protein